MSTHYPPIQARRVLTIADDEKLRNTLTRGLGRHHFESLALASDSALEVLPLPGESRQEALFDVVLLDVGPGLQPRTRALLERLQARGDHPRTVCLVALRDGGSLAAWKVATTLVKPIDLAELASELGRVARQWAAPAEGDAVDG